MSKSPKLTPSEVAALACDFCGGPAFTPEQQLDGEFLDRAARDHDQGISHPCPACQNRLFAALQKAPVISVPIQPPKATKRR